MDEPIKPFSKQPEICKRHVCSICNKSFKRRGHCARHERSRHTRETPFPCRYCHKAYRRSDTAVRHEKAAHERQYSPRIIPDEGRIVSPTPEDTLRHPYGPHADPRGPSDDESGNRTASPVIERPVPICRRYTCLTADERISQALAILDFTTLHSEALSANHLTVEHPEPLPETELTQRKTVSGSDRNYKREGSTSFCKYETPNSAGSELDFAVPTAPFQSPTTRQPRHCNPSSQHDVSLPLGVMFDPLWNPAMTRKAAIAAYEIDLHRESLRNHGLL